MTGEMNPVALDGGGHGGQSAPATDRGQGRGECVRTSEDGKQFGGMGGVHADESEQSRRKIVAVAVGRSYLAMALCAQYCRFPERDVAAEIGGSETMRICRVGRKRALFHLR
ncbi:hypothetical protein GCM10020255_100310 [Rhodococcus baikonurensis]